MTPKMTVTVQLVLRALLEADGEKTYGLDIVHSTGLTSGTVGPILIRLEKAGWLTSQWEKGQRGQPRRYYSFTEYGRTEALAQLISRGVV